MNKAVKDFTPGTASAAPQEFRIRWNFEPWTGMALLDTWLDMGSLVQDFYADRIREDVKTQHRMLHCKSPAEFFEIQAEFTQKAAEDYRVQAGRMAELAAKLGVPFSRADQPKT